MTNKRNSFYGDFMPGRYGLPEPYVGRRIKSAQKCADEGGCVLDVARLWGVTYTAAFTFLRKHDLGTLETLKANRPTGVLVPREEIRRRIGIYYHATKAGRSKNSAAKEIGITLPGLTNWLKTNVPDGIDQAYEDYFGEEEIAA